MEINDFSFQTEQRCIVGYLDSFSLTRVLRDQQARLASRKGMISRKGTMLLRELQSVADEE